MLTSTGSNSKFQMFASEAGSGRAMAGLRGKKERSGAGFDGYDGCGSGNATETRARDPDGASACTELKRARKNGASGTRPTLQRPIRFATDVLATRRSRG